MEVLGSVFSIVKKEIYDFSVVLAIYSGTNVQELNFCLDSINNQTLLPNEIIMVVDGVVGVDLSRFLDAYSSKVPIKILKLESNVGPGAARNAALECVHTEFVAIMDSDDVCVQDRFESQVEMFKLFPFLDVVGGRIIEFYNDDINITYPYDRKIFFNHEDIFRTRNSVIPVNNVTAMIRTKSMKAVGGYPNLRFGEDYVLWLHMLSKGYKFANLDKVLVKVRVGEDFYERRTGLVILKREFKYVITLYNMGLISKSKLMFFLIRSSIVRMLPKRFYNIAREWFNK